MTELHFKGKDFVYNHHLAVPFRPLIPDEKKGIGPVRLDGNLIVHGDNLHALKALTPLYAGKVDCVFIDPPYNTGNENWCYSDNVSAPMIKEWLNANPVGVEDGLRHDKWCAMMWPRLRLLHELMSEKGTIWITLDRHESHRAKLMLDAIFGEDAGLGTLVWEKSDSPRMDTKTLSSSHDFILAYAKNADEMIFQRLENEEIPEHYNLLDAESGRKYYLKPLRVMGGANETRESSPNLYYPLTAPDGNEIYPKTQDGSDGAWRWSKNKTKKEACRIEWRKGRKGWSPYFRIYADTSFGRPPETIWYHKDVGSSRKAKSEIKQIFGNAAFDTPKPLGLLSRVMEIATEPDSIVLDSFAGSGTTAHAVLAANKRDGGNRRFILVEMEDYADKLTAERVRRVINGYKFKGVQKTELLRENVSWKTLQNPGRLTSQVESIENLHGHEYGKIRKELKNGALTVTGEKTVEEKTGGLGGEFTYCTLGEAVEVEKLLNGENLPSYPALGSVLFNMAANRALDSGAVREKDFYLGEAAGRHIWMIYKPDLEWLKSDDAALTLTRARRFAAADAEKPHLVIAAARYVSQKLLNEEGLQVEFTALPYALYRIDRS